MHFVRVELVTREPVRNPEAPVYAVLNRREDLLALYGTGDHGPGIDLERCFLVAVHRGYCPSGGYSVRVRSLEQQGDQVTVRVDHRDPRPGDFVTQAITYPQDLVQVERSELNPAGRLHFRFTDEREVTRAEVAADIA